VVQPHLDDRVRDGDALRAGAAAQVVDAQLGRLPDRDPPAGEQYVPAWPEVAAAAVHAPDGVVLRDVNAGRGVGGQRVGVNRPASDHAL
jgi:hypothetical protein